MFTKETNSSRFFLISVGIILLIFLTSSYLFATYIVNSDQTTETYISGNNKTIIIDAGHGGEDVGAIGTNNVYEKDLNMQISIKLGDYLKAAGFNVIYTRSEDCLLYTEEQNIKGMRKIYDLKNRVAIANSYSDAIFISIHMNSFGQQNCSGLQIYHSANTASQNIASSVQNSVKSLLQPNNRRNIKSGEGIYVLENSSIPSILIECGFISNPEECEKLCQKEYQKELCFAILCGIIEYERNK